MEENGQKMLLLQCNANDTHHELIACARYNIDNEYKSLCKTKGERKIGRIYVVFVIQLPRVAGGCFVGFQVCLKIPI